jgi:hypothetical protein
MQLIPWVPFHSFLLHGVPPLETLVAVEEADPLESLLVGLGHCGKLASNSLKTIRSNSPLRLL